MVNVLSKVATYLDKKSTHVTTNQNHYKVLYINNGKTINIPYA